MLCFECLFEVSKTVGNTFLGIDIPGGAGDQFIIESIDTSTPEQFRWLGKGFSDFDSVVRTVSDSFEAGGQLRGVIDDCLPYLDGGS